MRERILFTIREGRTLPFETWQRFTEKARAAGNTPAAVIRQLIERYLQENRAHDVPTEKAHGPE